MSRPSNAASGMSSKACRHEFKVRTRGLKRIGKQLRNAKIYALKGVRKHSKRQPRYYPTISTHKLVKTLYKRQYKNLDRTTQ